MEHALYYAGEMYTISSREVFVQEGVRAAMQAWKKKNEVPETRKEAASARPTGRCVGVGSVCVRCGLSVYVRSVG